LCYLLLDELQQFRWENGSMSGAVVHGRQLREGKPE
jgi:hypothetical protein